MEDLGPTRGSNLSPLIRFLTIFTRCEESLVVCEFHSHQSVLMTWECRSAVPLATPSAGSFRSAWLRGMSVGFLHN